MPDAAAERFDYIVVGAGSVGCVLANRLSADPTHRVLVLEAGGPARGFWLKLPVGYFRSIHHQRYARLFDTEPGEGTAGRAIVWPRRRRLEFHQWTDLHPRPARGFRRLGAAGGGGLERARRAAPFPAARAL